MQPPISEVPSPLGNAVQIRSRRIVRLGPVAIDLRSTEPDFKGFRFFSQAFDPQTSPASGCVEPDFTLTLCNLNTDGPWPIEALARKRDLGYRGKRMSVGYYLTDHFGPPAYLMSSGTHYWIFAESFEPILWPYAVKYLLTRYSLEHNLLHLKAVAVAIDGQGVILVGRGGSGKTILLNQLCRAGAQILSNTHTLLDGRTLLGIQTAMRVRPDEFFGPIIAARHLSPSIKASEYTADPVHDLGWSSTESAPLRCVCLVDYKGRDHREIRQLDREILFDYMEQFSLAVNVYGLKDDLLDALGGDVIRFSAVMSQAKAKLRALLEGARCYYLSCDSADSANLEAIQDLLRASNNSIERRPASQIVGSPPT